MKLSELLKNVTPIAIHGNAEVEITGVNIDSRKIANGHLFIAMKGTQVDGHQFIGKAIEQGAVAVLLEDMPNTLNDNVTYVQVESTENTAGKVATLFYGDPSHKLKLVGVTGTNGKTPPYYIICSENLVIRWAYYRLSATISMIKQYQPTIQLQIQ